jgi:hypothetical protein
MFAPLTSTAPTRAARCLVRSLLAVAAASDPRQCLSLSCTALPHKTENPGRWTTPYGLHVTADDVAMRRMSCRGSQGAGSRATGGG